MSVCTLDFATQFCVADTNIRYVLYVVFFQTTTTKHDLRTMLESGVCVFSKRAHITTACV